MCITTFIIWFKQSFILLGYYRLVGMAAGGGVGNSYIPEQKEKEILEIQREILNEAGGRIAKDLGRSLSIISEMVFVRTARFIMELIQNAEDSLIGANNKGEMEIAVSDKRVKVIHNGKPFDRDDLNAICGVRSTKKPERGTLGYLGIGFKSVFKITDCPQISFRNKNDRMMVSTCYIGLLEGNHVDWMLSPGCTSASFSFTVILSSPWVNEVPVFTRLTNSNPALLNPEP